MIPRVLSCVLACTSFTAHALDYVETFDLPNGVFVDMPSIGTLDVGANSMSGSIESDCNNGDCNSGVGDPRDAFHVTVAAGTLLRSVTIANIGTTGPAGFSALLELRTPPSDAVNISFEFPINAVSGNVLHVPLAAGEYSFSVVGYQSAEGGLYRLPYSLAFGVSAVPEPATALLLACGGWLLAARRRMLGTAR